MTYILTCLTEGEQHVISKVETHLSDGSTQISSTLAPETAQLLSKLHPNMFSNASIVQVLCILDF